MHDLSHSQLLEVIRRYTRTFEAALILSGMPRPEAAGVADMALRNAVSAVTSGVPAVRQAPRLRVVS